MFCTLLGVLLCSFIFWCQEIKCGKVTLIVLSTVLRLLGSTGTLWIWYGYSSSLYFTYYEGIIMSEYTTEEIHHHVKTYVMVFVALAALTIVTVAISYLDLGVVPAVILALIVASIKGSLVACYFMHLISEKIGRASCRERV